jgi:hypothetical protein
MGTSGSTIVNQDAGRRDYATITVAILEQHVIAYREQRAL